MYFKRLSSRSYSTVSHMHRNYKQLSKLIMFEYESKWENFTFDIAMDYILTMLKEIIAYDIMRLKVLQGQNDNFTKH